MLHAMEVVGPDGRSYEVRPAGEDDHYELFLAGDRVARFVLEPNRTPVTIEKQHQKTVKESTVLKIAEDFVDRGGAGMRML